MRSSGSSLESKGMRHGCCNGCQEHWAGFSKRKAACPFGCKHKSIKWQSKASCEVQPMIKNIKLFCCEYFAEAPAVKQRATRPWRKRWAAYSVLCFNVLVEMGTAVAPWILTMIAEYKKQHIFVSFVTPKRTRQQHPTNPH